MEILMAQGVEPSAIKNRPVLLPGLDLFFEAYNQLQHDRSVGMTVGTIPWSSILNWSVFHGITEPDDVYTLQSHIRALEKTDQEFHDKKETKK